MLHAFEERKLLPSLNLSESTTFLDHAYQSSKSWALKKHQWNGKTVVCIGNGPSLNNTDISALNGQLLIGTNRAYELLDIINARGFELVIQDSHRLQEIAPSLDGLGVPLLLGSHDLTSAQFIHSKTKETLYFAPKLIFKRDCSSLVPAVDMGLGFSTSPLKGLFYGHSVIFSAIQIAFFYGAKRIILIGVDMDYSGASHFVDGVPNIWPSFSYEKHCRGMFIYFKKFLDNHGCQLINATPGGKVDVLPRLGLREALT
ncbi:hypothetical protein [Synechococcus sp. CB0205]|uniref:hypothetical protein n=1 Tax=Synechococcus sp. CB0205 TaxID=232363 RepID=UPI0012EA732D|nr:hypothetical protein [Synechococcus sp. CB0205]